MSGLKSFIEFMIPDPELRMVLTAFVVIAAVIVVALSMPHVVIR